MSSEDILQKVLEKVIDLSEKTAIIATKIDAIEKHTSVMNSELGVCQEKIANLEKYSIRKDLKRLGIQGASVGTVFTVIYWILRILRVIP